MSVIHMSTVNIFTRLSYSINTTWKVSSRFCTVLSGRPFTSRRLHTTQYTDRDKFKEMSSYTTLNNGEKIPQIGLGTSRISAENLEKTIRTAINLGYRHIDTAFNYQNEVAIGNVLQNVFKEEILKREELFVTTKIHIPYMEEGDVGPALDESLRRLKLDYVDLCLIHLPCAAKNPGYYPDEGLGPIIFTTVDHRVTWKAMEELIFAKKAKSIGVSNFNCKQLQNICQNCRIIPTINQVEVHAGFSQVKLHEFCIKLGIQLEAFAPLGSPNFRGPAHLNCAGDTDNLVERPEVVELAQKYNRTPGQILLRNLVQRNIVVVPKSENPKRLKENIQVFNFSLTDEDMCKINKLDTGKRRFVLSLMKEHPDYPFLDEN